MVEIKRSVEVEFCGSPILDGQEGIRVGISVDQDGKCILKIGSNWYEVDFDDIKEVLKTITE